MTLTATARLVTVLHALERHPDDCEACREAPAGEVAESCREYLLEQASRVSTLYGASILEIQALKGRLEHPEIQQQARQFQRRLDAAGVRLGVVR